MFRSKFVKLVGTITVLNLLAKFFAFAREITIGYIYGTTYEADSIIAAFTIPNFLYVVIGGSINTAFISLYSKMPPQKQRTFAQTVYTIMLIISTVITILFLLFPAFWMNLFFSGMSPEALALTTKLFVVTAPATLFLIVSMLMSGIHNVHGHYRLATIATVVFNLAYVLIGLVLTPVLSVYSYALGATFGSFAILWLLGGYIKKLDLAPLKLKMTKMPEMKSLFYLVLPLMLGGATMHFYLIIQRIFAAGIGDGAIAAVNYASKITQLPRGVLMASVTTIIYPMLAKAAGKKEFAKITQAYQQGFRLLIILLVPASMFAMMYAKEIVILIFQYGNFKEEATNYTYPLLQIFALSIFSLSLNTYITRFYYALENTLLPNILNIISVFGVNIIVILYLIEDMGAIAIAYGTVISAFFNMILLIVFAKWKFNLSVAEKGKLFKLMVFTVLAIAVIYGMTFITIPGILFGLIVGLIATFALIFLGWKFA